MVWNRQTGCPTHFFSLVVCRKPGTNLWLAVDESRQRGWWLPGGHVDPGGNHIEAAVRETKEEAGMDVTLVGILRIENNISREGARQRVIFYAEPTDPSQEPKSIPDKESEGATWLTVEQLEEKRSLSPGRGGLRGTELLDWARYIEDGGTIYPLSLLSSEKTSVPFGK